MDATNKLNSALGLGGNKKNKQLPSGKLTVCLRKSPSILVSTIKIRWVFQPVMFVYRRFFCNVSAVNKSFTFLPWQSAISKRTPGQKNLCVQFGPTNLSYHLPICIDSIHSQFPTSALKISSYPNHLFVETSQPQPHTNLKHPSDSSSCLVGKNLRTTIPEGQCSSCMFTNLTSCSS